MVSRSFNLFVIIAAGFTSYLCALLAGFLSIDDASMISSVTTYSYTLKQLFLGGGNEYYRPLVVLSYVANSFLSGVSPMGFHAVNIGIHLLNSLLVYYLAVTLLDDIGTKKEAYALIAALIFCLHPINTEPVVWVSARPDLLCTFFSILVLILLANHKADVTACTLLCLFVAAMSALWAKESAVSLWAAGPLFLFLDGRRKLKDTALLVSVFLSSSVLYYYLRSGGKPAVLDRGVGSVVKSIAAPHSKGPDWFDAIAAYGFYLKKLIFPFPLNFTILTFEKTSALIALTLAILAAFLLLRRSKVFLLPMLVIFAGIVPPVIAYVGSIPWTPLGERYLYLPMVGFSLVISFLFLQIKSVWYIVPVALALLLGIPTIDRVGVWCDAREFWNDALRKAPGFGKSYSALGAVAFDEGDYATAEYNMSKAIALGFDQALIWNNLGKIYSVRKDYKTYETVMLKAVSRSPTPSAVYQEMAQTLVSGSNAKNGYWGYGKAIDYLLKAVAKDSSFSEAYYNVGKLYLVIGDEKNASLYLTRYLDVDKNGYFRPFAVKMINNIKTGRYRSMTSLQRPEATGKGAKL